MLGVLGVALHNSLGESALFYPQLKNGVGGCWGCWGWCWGGVGQKKCPPSRGDGHFATKAVRSYGVFAGGAGGFLGVLRGSLWGGLGGGWVVLRTFAVWPLCKSEV